MDPICVYILLSNPEELSSLITLFLVGIIKRHAHRDLLRSSTLMCSFPEKPKSLINILIFKLLQQQLQEKDKVIGDSILSLFFFCVKRKRKC